mgnify:CR=1 FL=1
MPQINRSLLTYAPETTYGTVPGTGFVPVKVQRDPELAPLVADRVTREEVTPWFTADADRLTNRRQTISFGVYDGGSGTAGTAPNYGGLYLPCGMNATIVASTSVTYSLISSSIPSITLRWYADGILHQMAGARGTCSWTRNIGELPMVMFEFTGLYSQPTDTAFPSLSITAQAEAEPVNSTNTPTITLNSVAKCMSEYEIALNNQVVFREDAGCTARVEVQGRSVEGRVQCEDVLIATQNIYSLSTGTAFVPLVIGHTGGTAGRRSTITTTNSNILEPTFAPRDNVRYVNLPYKAISTDGTSEFSIAYT